MESPPTFNYGWDIIVKTIEAIRRHIMEKTKIDNLAGLTNVCYSRRVSHGLRKI